MPQKKPTTDFPFSNPLRDPGARGGDADSMEEMVEGRSLESVRFLAYLLDSSVRVPGTSLTFGLDPILGLFPGFGDAITLGVGVYPLFFAAREGATRLQLLRMIGNLSIDAVVGSIPLLGDVFDFAFKANTRNVTILEQVLRENGSRRAHTEIVVLGVLFLLFVTLLIALLTGSLIVGGIWFVFSFW